MKEAPLSLCERSALLSQLHAGLRADGRRFNDVRPLQIHFGKEYGSCTVVLGNTRVVARVTCEVVEPRPSRPNEGKLSIGVHLSPMAAAHFEQGRSNELIDELQQMLDRNIKESRCIDLESLCIMADESVWQFKLDITVLNHDGNLGDACNISGVSALRHFHRPDVTVEEDKRVTIHTEQERELIPTFLKKIPVCMTFAFFSDDEATFMVMDPTYQEERVMSGKLTIGLNPHGEITSLLFPGKVQLQKKQIQRCIKHAFKNAKAAAEMVVYLIEKDLDERKTIVKPTGFTDSLHSDASHSKMVIVERVEEGRSAKISRLLTMERRGEEPELSDQKETDQLEELSDGMEEETTGTQVPNCIEEEEHSDSLEVKPQLVEDPMDET